EKAMGKNVDEHQVRVRSAGDYAETFSHDFCRKGFGVCYHLLGVIFELRLQRFFKANSFRRDDVHERAALDSGESNLIYGSRIIFAAENHAGARTAQGFVRGGGNNI